MSVSISLASPAQLRALSSGEISQRALLSDDKQPVIGGLLCPLIFGRAEQCMCGQLRGEEHYGARCSACRGVVLSPHERGLRFGHINLAAPIPHPWFIELIAALLHLSPHELEKRSGRELQSKLREVNVEFVAASLRQSLQREQNTDKRADLSTQLDRVEALQSSGQSPENLLIEVLLVLPPSRRSYEPPPLVPVLPELPGESPPDEQVDAFSMETSYAPRDLDALYALLLQHNESRKSAEGDERKEKASEKKLRGTLNEIFSAIYERPRPDPLNKIVDFSGCAVAIPDPELPLSQCKIPVTLAVDLLRPLLLQRLKADGLAATYKDAQLFLADNPDALDVIEELLEERPLFIHQPEHKVQVLSLWPSLSFDNTLHLNPSVYRALISGDGSNDLLSFHLPLTRGAQRDAKRMVASHQTLCSPASDSTIFLEQELLTGVSLLTSTPREAPTILQRFASADAVELAIEHGYLSLLEPIQFRPSPREKLIKTTAGRVILAKLLSPEDDAELLAHGVSDVKARKLLSVLLPRDSLEAERTLSELRRLVSSLMTRHGLSFCVDDLQVHPERAALFQEHIGHIRGVQEQYEEGLITDSERENKLVDLGSYLQERLRSGVSALLRGRFPFDLDLLPLCKPIGFLYDAEQKRFLSPHPITESLREGLSSISFFFACYIGRRKLLHQIRDEEQLDPLYRSLLGALCDIKISQLDCGTTRGLPRANTDWLYLHDRALGSVLATDVLHPTTKENLVRAGDILTRESLQRIDQAEIQQVSLRSPLCCEAKEGVCARCYGGDARPGDAVGLIAARSIRWPQDWRQTNTLRYQFVEKESPFYAGCAPCDGTLKLIDARVVKSSAGEDIVINHTARWTVISSDGQEQPSRPLPYGAMLFAPDQSLVTRMQHIVSSHPSFDLIISSVDGVARFVDVVPGSSLTRSRDEATGFDTMKIASLHIGYHPHIEIIDPSNESPLFSRGRAVTYFLPPNSLLCVSEMQPVKAGDVLAKLEKRPTLEHKDALARIISCFEAQIPYRHAHLAQADGVLSFGRSDGDLREILLSAGDQVWSQWVPVDSVFLVEDGDRVQRGAPLTEGPADPHQVFATQGSLAAGQLLLEQLQEAFGLRGERVYDRHVELALRQMLRVDPGRIVGVSAAAKKLASFLEAFYGGDADGLELAALSGEEARLSRCRNSLLAPWGLVLS